MNNNDSTKIRNNYICIGILSTSLIFTIILRICLMLENYRRDRLSSDEYDNEASIKEPCDWVSLYFNFT